MTKLRLLYFKYCDSLKMGLLIGLFVSNGYLLYQQSQTIQKVLDISRQIKESNQITVDYVQCIALIHPDFRTEETIQNCVKNGVVPNTIRATTSTPQITNAPTPVVVPEQPQTAKLRNTETTSVPPEQPKQPGFIERLNTQIEDTLTSVDNFITGLTR